MKRSSYAFAALLPLVSAIFFSPGCSIFTPVGNAISTQYENTVSYFNAYYNASRLFQEAEDEIVKAEKAARSKEQTSQQPAMIPPTARQKLALVIDKCSNILSFHPGSTLVDDALFLVGKSFFYMGDYVKAERKFAEMLTQYPQSNIALEAQAWYVESLERQNKSAEALRMSEGVIRRATDEGEQSIEVDARREAARIYRKLSDDQNALAMLNGALEKADDRTSRGQILMAIGDIHASSGRYRQAAESYLKAGEESPDLYDMYRGNLLGAISRRDAGQYGAAREILESMKYDFRFKEWLSSIRLELGRTYCRMDMSAEGVAEFVFVDTTYARTENGTKADYELGNLYEHSSMDYPLARTYYARGLAAPTVSLAAELRRKSAAFDRYFDSHRKLHIIDSLAAVVADTAFAQKRDSTAADSLRRVVMLRTAQYPMNADSLRLARSRLEQDLGDVFYSELEVPDSAMVWYTRSMESWRDSVRTPRVLFILGEIARATPDKNFVPTKERYQELVAKYPNSEFAKAVRASIGLAPLPEYGDPAREMYEEAETLMDSGRTQEALERLRPVSTMFPKSPYAVRSQYAVAWLYEYPLNIPDSAIAWYRRVAKIQPTTPQVLLAIRKTSAIPLPVDSTAKSSVADTSRTKSSIVDTTRQGTGVASPSKPLPPVDEELLEQQIVKSRRRPAEGRSVAPRDSAAQATGKKQANPGEKD